MTDGKRKRRPKGAPRRGTSQAFIAQVVADSDTLLGTAGAAKKHGLSERTVKRYRALVTSATVPALTLSVTQKRAEMFDTLRDETVALVRKIMARIGTVVETSDNLYELNGAWKIGTDRLSQDNVTSKMLDDDDDTDDTVSAPAPLRVLKGGA